TSRIITALGIGADDVFLLSGDLERGASANVDTDGAMHTYRIQILGTLVNVYYDGSLLLTGSTYFNPNVAPTRAILWGEGSDLASGTSEWEFFRHNASTQACHVAPVIVTIGDKTVDEGSTLAFSVAATDIDV